MKPAPFHYVRPATLEAAVAALAAADGDAKVLAGGQSLVPMLNFRLTRPGTLVDITRLPNLAFIEEREGVVAVGALTRHRALETSPLVAQKLPVVAAAMRHVAHLAIRNRGTIGGSLSHADPAAELPLMAVLHDATVRAAGADGTRDIAANDFFLGALTTDLRDDEILSEVLFPTWPDHAGWAFEEVSRRSGDFALACAAALMQVREATIVDVRLGVTGVAETPIRLAAAESLLSGRTLEAVDMAAVVAAARGAVAPNTDLHASADYRRHLVGILAEDAVRNAYARGIGAAP